MLARAVAVAVVVIAGGCRQLFGLDDTEVAEPADARSDAGPAGPCTTGNDAMAMGLRMCLEFEDSLDDGQAHDGSIYAHHATIAGVTRDARVGAGGTSEAAARVDAASSIHVAENLDLDLPGRGPLTMEMWINPGALPTGGLRMGLLDNANQYGMFLLPSGMIQCAIILPSGGVMIGPVGVNEWSHVACTYDGNTITGFLNGQVTSTTLYTGDLNTGGMLGTRVAQDNNEPIGAGDENLIGAIDDVRVWSRVLNRSELCAYSGPFTAVTCPP